MSESMRAAPAACGCHNLDDNEVRKRKVLGYGSLVVAFAMVALSKVQAQPQWMQGLPTVAFFSAYLNLFQARSRTCVLLAFLDRDMSQGTLGPVADRETGWLLKIRSAKLVIGALMLALLSMAICWRL